MGLDKNTSWTGYQAQHIVPAELSNHPVLKKIGMEMDDASNGIFLRTRSSGGISTITRHEGYHSPYNKFMQNKLDNIDLNKSVVEIQEEVYHLQQTSKKCCHKEYQYISKIMWLVEN